MLAEAVSLDGGALLVVFVVGLVVLVALAGLVALGFVLAPKAAEGSRGALAGWIAVLAAEGIFCATSVAAMVRGELSLFTLLFPAIVTAQVARFVAARRD